jgi:hypothetical protein
LSLHFTIFKALIGLDKCFTYYANHLQISIKSEDSATWGGLAINASALDYHPKVQMLIIQLHWLMILEARYDEDDEAIAILGHPKIDFEASCR